MSPLADCRIRHTSREGEGSAYVTKMGDNTEPVGRFHYATLLRSRLQVTASWQVSADNCEVLARVAHLLGRASQGIGADTCSVTTATKTLDIILHGPGALRLSWCRDGRHTCDGDVQCNYGTQRSCTCPPSLPERRMATRHGRGCEPRVEVFFQIAQDPALGMFTFVSGSWSFAEQVINARNVLQANSQLTLARLSLRRADQRLYSGRPIAYTRPALALVEISRQPHRTSYSWA
jgi:hypothetical protein